MRKRFWAGFVLRLRVWLVALLAVLELGVGLEVKKAEERDKSRGVKRSEERGRKGKKEREGGKRSKRGWERKRTRAYTLPPSCGRVGKTENRNVTDRPIDRQTDRLTRQVQESRVRD